MVDALSQTSRIYYGVSGLITNIADPFGRSMSVAYSNGYVSTVRDMGGVESRYTFYTNGLEMDYVKSLRTDCGEVSFSYALPDGSTTGTWERSTMTATFADGSTEKLYYTGGEGGRRDTEFTDRNGNKTVYTIGLGISPPYQGRIHSVTHPDDTTQTYKYNAALQVTNVVDEAAKTWVYAYNEVGELTESITPNGYQLNYEYTNGGFDVVKVIEETTNTLLKIGYAPNRDVSTLTNVLGQSLRMGHDAYGRLTNVVDALSVETILEYGSDYRLSAVKRAGTTLASFKHDAIGRVTNFVGPESIQVAFGFDGLDRMTNAKVGTEQPYTWTYATNSLLLASQSDRTGRRTRYGYDSLERVHKVSGADSSFFLLDYDSGDRLTMLTDGNANQTKFVYDLRGRMTKKSYPGGAELNITYDTRGLPTTFVSARGLVATNKFNSDGLLTNRTHSTTNTAGQQLSYNDRNLLVASVDGWSTNTYSHDVLGRLTGMVERIDAGEVVSWSYFYDEIGQATGVSWTLIVTTNVFTQSRVYSYDSLGRITNVASDLGSFAYSYTNAGLQVAQLRYPNTDTATMKYDSLGRLTNLTYSTGGSWQYSYDSRDFITRRVDPAGYVYTYMYDEVGRLTYASGLNGATTVSGYPFRYAYDWADNRVQQSEGSAQRDYSYNEDNQLVSIGRSNVLRITGYVNTWPTQVLAWTQFSGTNYAPIDLTVTYASSTQTFFTATASPLGGTQTVWEVFVRSVSASNAFVIYTNQHPAVTTRSREYDGDGNLVDVDAGTAHEWDAENRQIVITYSGGSKTEFRYDGFDRLREMSEYSSGGTLTNKVRYLWQGMLPVAEFNSTNGLVRTFTWGVDLGGGIGSAGGIGGLLGIRQYQGGTTNYNVRTDGKGNVTEVRRTNGTVVGSYSYAPYGRQLTQTNTYRQPFRFQSKLYQAQSGFVYFGYRWYDPTIGRWLSRDPIAEDGGLNLYAYCAQNPLALFDPDGRWVETAADVANLALDAQSLGENLGEGRWGSAALDSAGLLLDGAAAIIPGIPAFAGPSIRALRKAAVAKAWKQECELVKRTGSGTRDWTEREIKELLEKGKVEGYQGHHVNSVKDHPELAGDPNNIEFQTRKDHLESHDGDWRNPTAGELVDRTSN